MKRGAAIGARQGALSLVNKGWTTDWQDKKEEQSPFPALVSGL
jgi:hypothetical protein